MGKPSDRMPVKKFLMEKVLNKAQESAKTWAILMCLAYGYGRKETKDALRELRKTGQIYCNRREEFLRIT